MIRRCERGLNVGRARRAKIDAAAVRSLWQHLGGLLRGARERDDRVALVKQRLHHEAADAAGGAGDGDVQGRGGCKERGGEENTQHW